MREYELLTEPEVGTVLEDATGGIWEGFQEGDHLCWSPIDGNTWGKNRYITWEYLVTNYGPLTEMVQLEKEYNDPEILDFLPYGSIVVPVVSNLLTAYILDEDENGEPCWIETGSDEVRDIDDPKLIPFKVVYIPDDNDCLFEDDWNDDFDGDEYNSLIKTLYEYSCDCDCCKGNPINITEYLESLMSEGKEETGAEFKDPDDEIENLIFKFIEDFENSRSKWDVPEDVVDSYLGILHNEPQFKKELKEDEEKSPKEGKRSFTEKFFDDLAQDIELTCVLERVEQGMCGVQEADFIRKVIKDINERK